MVYIVTDRLYKVIENCIAVTVTILWYSHTHSEIHFTFYRLNFSSITFICNRILTVTYILLIDSILKYTRHFVLINCLSSSSFQVRRSLVLWNVIYAVSAL
jgi:hypothetical protein